MGNIRVTERIDSLERKLGRRLRGFQGGECTMVLDINSQKNLGWEVCNKPITIRCIYIKSYKGVTISPNSFITLVQPLILGGCVRRCEWQS